MLLTRVLPAAVAILCVSVSGCAEKVRAVSFAQDVQPVLDEYCLSCHRADGEGYAASGFSVETYGSLVKGTKFGPVIVPGSSLSSTLVVLIDHKAHPAINMPYRLEKIPEKDIAVVKAWVDQGAKNN